MARFKLLAISLLLLMVPVLIGNGRAAPPSPFKLAITFDDMPVNGTLPPGVSRDDIVQSIVKTLKAHEVPQVYGFINAVHIKYFPELVSVLRTWREAGYLLGNHGYLHMELKRDNLEEFVQNAKANEPLLKELMTDQDWRYWRFTYLHAGDAPEQHDSFLKFLHDSGYKVAEVSLNFDDWAYGDYYTKCMALGDKAGLGALEANYLNRARIWVEHSRNLSQRLFSREVPQILLLHLSDFEMSVLPKLLNQLESDGAQFVTLPEALADEAYSLDPQQQGEGVVLDRLAKARKINLLPYPPPLSVVASICPRGTGY